MSDRDTRVYVEGMKFGAALVTVFWIVLFTIIVVTKL